MQPRPCNLQRLPCAARPMDALQRLFFAFKLRQGTGNPLVQRWFPSTLTLSPLSPVPRPFPPGGAPLGKPALPGLPLRAPQRLAQNTAYKQASGRVFALRGVRGALRHVLEGKAEKSMALSQQQQQPDRRSTPTGRRRGRRRMDGTCSTLLFVLVVFLGALREASAQTAASLFGVESVLKWSVPPQIHWLYPPKGHIRGGTMLTIYGTGFHNSPLRLFAFRIITTNSDRKE